MNDINDTIFYTSRHITNSCIMDSIDYITANSTRYVTWDATEKVSLDATVAENSLKDICYG